MRVLILTVLVVAVAGLGADERVLVSWEPEPPESTIKAVASFTVPRKVTICQSQQNETISERIQREFAISNGNARSLKAVLELVDALNRPALQVLRSAGISDPL